jgi:hypothetical protein
MEKWTVADIPLQAGTLQTSGPGRPQNSIEKIVASFMSQDAAHGALPTLRAATAMDAAQGSYYGPDRMFQLKGDQMPAG